MIYVENIRVWLEPLTQRWVVEPPGAFDSLRGLPKLKYFESKEDAVAYACALAKETDGGKP